MLFARFSRLCVALGALVMLLSLTVQQASAYPRFAKKEGVSCVYCHVNPGGPRNFRGLYYKDHNLAFDDFDEQYESKAAGVAANSMGGDALPKTAGYPDVKVVPVLNFVVKDIDGKAVNLGRYQGDVIMVVNVASKCGNTPQYAALEQMYEKYKAQGFTILAFPANDFGQQEPGTNKEIKDFCTSTYKVAFPIFAKTVVKSDAKPADPNSTAKAAEMAPLYKYLTSKETDPKFAGDIDWNFAKFLINRKGEIVARFKASVKPDTPEVVSAIEKELKTPMPDAAKTTASISAP